MKIKLYSKTTIVMTVISCILCAVAIAPSVFAGGSEGGGGQTASGCNSSYNITYKANNPWTACEWSGYGWMYFVYEEAATSDTDINYGPTTKNAGGSLTIPKICYEAAGGFYHYGYFQYKESGTYGGDWNLHGLTSIGNPQYQNAGAPSHRTSSAEAYNGDAVFNKYGAGHELTKNGVTIAKAVGPKSDKEAWKAYEEWRQDPASKGYVQTWNGIDAGGTINYFCYGPKMGSAGLTGKITARIGAQYILNGGSYEATADVTVINYTDTVMRSGDNLEVTVDVCYSGDDDYNHQSRYSNRCKRLEKNSSDSYPTTVSVNTPEGMSAVTICHTLTYPPTFDHEGKTSGTATEKHCMKITRGNKPEVPQGCGSMGLEYNDYVAKSEAQMIFKLNGKSTTLGYGQNKNSETYWGKPGDRVQYEYKLCSSSEYSRNYPPDNSLDGHNKPAKNFTSAHDPKFEFKGNPNNNYLFGMNPTSYSGDIGEDHFVYFTSPNTANYYCNIYEGNKAISTNHYQIPADSSYKCGASSVAQNSDLGKTFSQELKYNKVYTKMEQEPYQRWEVVGSHQVRRSCGWTDSEGHYHSCHYYTTVLDYDWVTHYYHWTEPAGSPSTVTLKGEVSVPYNYKLVPYTKRVGHTDGVVFPGSVFSTSSYVATLTRENKKVSGTYATATKATKIFVAAFTTSSSPSSEYKGDSGGLNSAEDVCRKFGGSNCQSLYSSTSQRLNEHSNMLSGATNENTLINNGGSNINNVMFATVPMEEPGVKFCVAVGVSPADSHDSYSTNPDSQTKALSQSGSSYYVGKPACVTIAKKPNFSTEGGDLKTNGSVVTSRSNVGGRIFGSWSEYGLVAKGDVRGMASGAAFAYTSPIYTSRSQKIAGEMVPGSRQYVCEWKYWGPFRWRECGYVYTDAHYNGGVINMASANAGIAQSGGAECTLGSQTYGNRDCDSHILGEGTGVINSTDMDAIARKVYQKYHMSGAEMQSLFKSTDGRSGLLNIAESEKINGVNTTTPYRYDGNTEEFYLFQSTGSAACTYSSDIGKYIQGQPTSNQYSQFVFNGKRYSNSAPQFCNAQGMKIWRAYKNSGNANVIFTNYPSNGAVYMGGAGTSDLGESGTSVTYRNPTYIFDIDGTFVVDEDMISSNDFINNEINDNYSSLDEIPTVVIFARNIIITNRVTRLDAWLIAGINGGEGLLNTCGAVYEGGSLKFIHPENSRSNNELSADICNQQLVINGFVYAKKAILNRTYGGGGNNINKFVQRGEIFNLRPDAFYWSFYQSQRNRILTTVYSRELPTRY